MGTRGRRGDEGNGRAPDRIASIGPEPTAEEAEVVASVLAMLDMPTDHDDEGESVPRSRWAEAGRRAARRGIGDIAGWGQSESDRTSGVERVTGGWRRQ